MKYFKVFNTEDEYIEYIVSGITPNVSTLRDSSKTWINAVTRDYSKEYFTIESLEDNNTIKMVRNLGGNNLGEYIVEYSTDEGSSWSQITLVANSAHTYDITTLNSGEKVMFRYVSGQFDRDNGSFTYFDSDGRFNVYGNITSLRATDFSGYTGVSDLYIYLFKGSKVVSAKDLVSPFQTISTSGFTGMFSGCTYLTDAPELPAATLGNECYKEMFYGCTSLVTAPNLIATSVPNNAYRSMFYGCSNLVNVQSILPATTVGESAYQSMFNSCTSLITAPELSATTLGISCYAYMFQNCSSLVTAPSELPATTLANDCYREMFGDCTSLISVPSNYLPAMSVPQNAYRSMFCRTSLVVAPNLPATTLGVSAYKYMFGECALLETAPTVLPALTASNNAYQNMFINCSALTNAPEICATTVNISACQNMFSDCTSLTTAPTIHATTALSSSFKAAFSGCTNLTTVQSTLSATTLDNDCYKEMFSGCKKLTTAPELPVTNLSGATYCYAAMFSGCTSLTATPSSLPATTLANGCYQSMFQGCTGLTTAPTSLPAATLTDSCYLAMFRDCTSLSAAPEICATTVGTSSCKNMFYGCTGITTAQAVLPALTLANGSYYSMYECTNITTAPIICATTVDVESCRSMFYLCSSLTTGPSELPATTLADRCYQAMFLGCPNLTTAPELPALTLASECYRSMFSGCNKLNYIKCLATNISASNCTSAWVQNVASSGTFVKYITMEDWTRGGNGIPLNWNIENYSDVHVTGVTLNTTATTITKGNTTTLTATVSPNDAYDKSVTWSTSDSSVATVSDGVVTAVGCGEAIITVTTTDGTYTAQCTTTVENPVTGVTLNTNVAYILTGEAYQLVATVAPSDACGDKSVTWSTSDSSIATVSNNGLVTAVASGSAVVTVTTTVGSYTATCSVEVSEPVAVTSVTLDESTLDITVGQTRQLTATVLPNNATDKSVTWSSSNNNIATVTSNGLVTAVSAGTANIIVRTEDGGYTASCEVTITAPGFTSMAIEGASSVSAETCTFRAICDNSEDVTSSATWSITAGSQYATINPNNGVVTILNGASESSVTIQAIYAGLTATTTATLTYLAGATSETTSVITTDVGGNSTSVVTTITTYADSSSTEVVETVVTDVNGELVGSTESTKTTNADGSYNGVTTNYDENGDPVNGSNVTGDTEGNVSTQTVEYDDSGNVTVTGYDIDTSGSGKTFNADGVNTDYYAFDVTHGFVLDFDFTIDFSNQPPNQHQGHHNILNAKRADPSPYYGFQIRQSNTNSYIQLGTQFETGGNINTTINPSSTTGSVGTYNLRIIYDPTSAGNTFTCIDTSSQTVLYVSDGVFPDIEELKYLKVTIGYAVNASGNPFRYSNITVSNFDLKKLKNVANPTITCDENEVTIACSTAGANIYYRLNLSGDYSAYTTSFVITADTVVQAYATGNDDTSDIIRVDCSYELEEPVISCDGEFVTITCPHVGTTIYYRLDESGSYSAYTTPIEITADTIVEAYSELSGYTSSTVKETCIYIEGVDEPVITCSENIVSISCDTVGAEIYYRLNESGNYSAYTEPFEITATTIVESYATLGVKTSETVNETCTYNPLINHRWHAADISDEYVCSGGNKYYKEYYQVTYDGGETWENVVPEQTRTGSLYEELSWDCNDFSSMYFTIHSLEDSNDIYIKRNTQTGNTEYYSVDSGSTWSTMPSGSGAKKVTTLNSGDTMWMKCTTSKWATAYDKNNTLYSTKNIKVYGNVMSLLYGDNFTGQTAVGEFGLCGLFFGTSATGTTNTKLVSAKNLVLPATTLNTSSYNGMFRGCTNLVDCPRVLPATTLYQDTYSSMFEGCTSLVEGPEIMATTIANTGSTSCMQRMFCMNRNSKVTAAMTKSPVLRIVDPTTANNTYQQIFCGNGNLVEVTILAEGTNLSFTNWLNKVSSSGVIKKLSATTLTNNSVNGKPSGWTYENID